MPDDEDDDSLFDIAPIVEPLEAVGREVGAARMLFVPVPVPVSLHFEPSRLACTVRAYHSAVLQDCRDSTSTPQHDKFPAFFPPVRVSSSPHTGVPLHRESHTRMCYALAPSSAGDSSGDRPAGVVRRGTGGQQVGKQLALAGKRGLQTDCMTGRFSSCGVSGSASKRLGRGGGM